MARPVLPLFTLIGAALMALLLATLGPVPNPLMTVFLAVLGSVLEITAVAWPGMGFSSAAPACYLAIALLPKSPVGWAALSLGTGVLLRALMRGGPTANHRLRESVSSALPVLLALMGARMLAHLQPAWLAFFVLDVYLPAAFLLPAQLARDLPAEDTGRWRRMRAKTVLSWLSTGFLAGPLAWLPFSKAVWLVPVLFGLQRSALAAVEAVREEDAKLLQQELDRSRRSEQRAKEDTERVRKELEVKVEERALFEELAREWASQPDWDSTLKATVRMALRLVPACRSTALFVEDEGLLVPAAFESPEYRRLESCRLLRQEEPLVREAHTRRREASGEASGLFPGEKAVALPVGEAVLYAGSRRPLEENALQLLRLLATQASEALKAARRYQELKDQAASSGRLRQELSQLEQLLEGSRALAGTLEVESLLRVLDDELDRLVPHSARVLWPRGGALPEGLGESVLQNNRPLLLDDVLHSRWKELPFRSLLAVPMGDQVVCLGHEQPHHFTREHQDALVVLCNQAALALQNATLHEEVREALERLRESEAQLVQSSKMAAVGQLAAGLAHELNTPLGTILLAIQSTLRSTIPDTLKPLLERARQSGARAKDIVEKLLFYSRDARAGRRKVSMAEVARDTRELLGQQLEGVEVKVVAEQDALVWCNQNEVQQVLSNLVLNARDAVAGCPQRVITVMVRPTETEAEVTVSDTGPGVPPEVQPRIFEPFFTTKPVGRGTGLGLWVSQQIVEAHGGTLVLEPPNRFVVKMPLYTGN